MDEDTFEARDEKAVRQGMEGLTGKWTKRL
jgi:hypothetical protein